MRLPAIVNVTLPAVETEADMVVDNPFESGSATVRVTVMGEVELLVMERVVIAAISLPA